MTIEKIIITFDDGSPLIALESDGLIAMDAESRLIEFECAGGDPYVIGTLHQTSGGWFLMSDDYHFEAKGRSYENVMAVGVDMDACINAHLNGSR
jgi:hypothetical protein